jgi:dienelactone hydrolase
MTDPPAPPRITEELIRIAESPVVLAASLVLPANARGIVLFAHGSGSSRFSARNRQVGRRLNEAGLATLLADLLTTEEERLDAQGAFLRFDIVLLARRLVGATDWLRARPDTRHLPIGYFGASTGAAAALLAAVARADAVRAIVSRGGRPDLAGAALAHVRAPTLLIVGGDDTEVRAEPEGPGRAACREGAGDRPRRIPPLRGARGPQAGRAAGPRVVRAAPGRGADPGGLTVVPSSGGPSAAPSG